MTFAETDDVDVNRSAPGLDDADGLWPMVMELFTKMLVLMYVLMPVLMLPLAMLRLMLYLTWPLVTVKHLRARLSCQR